jgi:DNA-binding response OmpR family regulator
MGEPVARKKILIVDDNQDFSRLLEVKLSAEGYEIVTAPDGLAGFERAKAEKPQLILLDIKMPRMDGFTFVRLLKKEDEIKDIPVIMLTDFEPMRELFQQEGIKDYFSKTGDMKILMKTIAGKLSQD